MNKKSVTDIAVQECLSNYPDIMSVVNDRIWQGSAEYETMEPYIVWDPGTGTNLDNMTSEIRNYVVEVHCWTEPAESITANDLQELVKEALETTLEEHLPEEGYYVVGVTQSSINAGEFGEQFQSIGTYEIRVGRR